MSASATISNIVTSSTAVCITATPDKNGYVPIDDCRNIWFYYPSFGAAILFSVLFGMSTVLHLFQAFHYRKRFCWVIIMGGAWETTGLILRVLSTRNQLSLGLYIPEELFILLAPLWINAFVYMTLGRMIHCFLPEQQIFGIKASRFSIYFICADIVAFIVQGIGGTIASEGPGEPASTTMLGIHIYMGGIGLQQLFILIFTTLAISFHRRMQTYQKQSDFIDNDKRRWKLLLYALYAVLGFITTRIIFRLVQYSGGVLSTVTTHEVFYYCFDALPMAFALWLLNVIHPGRILVGPLSEFPKKTREEKKEEKRQKKEAKKARKQLNRGKINVDINSSELDSYA